MFVYVRHVPYLVAKHVIFNIYQPDCSLKTVVYFRNNFSLNVPTDAWSTVIHTLYSLFQSYSSVVRLLRIEGVSGGRAIGWSRAHLRRREKALVDRQLLWR